MCDVLQMLHPFHLIFDQMLAFVFFPMCSVCCIHLLLDLITIVIFDSE